MDCIWLMFQTFVLAATAAIVAWYAWETKRLREKSSEQVEATLKHVAETERQTELQQRPFVIVEPASMMQIGTEHRVLKVCNIGSGTALSIRLVDGAHRTLEIPYLGSGASVTIVVQPTESDSDSQEGRRADELYYWPFSHKAFSRDVFLLQVRFHNVENGEYVNDVRITRTTFEIDAARSFL